MIVLPSNQYKIDLFLVNCEQLTVNNGEKTIKLPVKVFELLKLFILKENNAVELHEAIEIIWDGNHGVGKKGFATAMWHLRKTFADLATESEEIFRTLRNVGYILIKNPIPVEKALKGRSFLSAKIDWIKNYIWPIALTASLLLIIVIVFVYMFMEKQSPVAFQQAEISSITNFQGVEDHPSVSNDGHYLAFRWEREIGKGKIFIKNLLNDDSPIRLLTASKFEEGAPAWSPDDDSIAYMEIKENGECQIIIKQLVINENTVIDSGCSFNQQRSGLNWSPNGKYLVYPKVANHSIALFKYELEKQTITQLSFPQNHQQDVMAVWAKNSADIAFIREEYQQDKLIVLQNNGKEQLLLTKDSIVGLAWEHSNNDIFTNIIENASYVLQKFNLDTDTWQRLDSVSAPSNLTISQQSGQLFFTNYSSSEYIVQRSFNDERELRRISSSSRDMFASYVPESNDILFISNRAKNWDIWIKTANDSYNLTKGIGSALTPAVAPDSQHFVVNIKLHDSEKYQLFIADLPSGELHPIDTHKLIPENPKWSNDGQAILFIANNGDNSGVYRYQIDTKEILQLTSSNEVAVIDGDDGELYVSRDREDGIWKIDPITQHAELIIDDLDENDFGAYFWQSGSLFYLVRTEKHDLVKKYVADTADIVVGTYPANSIRKYYGITAADPNSYLVTLYNNDADIYSRVIDKT